MTFRAVHARRWLRDTPVKAPDWDALAPHWEHFEDGGLNREILAGLERLIRPPLLYVGSGRGGLAARVARL
jgi:hypothetical protein